MDVCDWAGEGRATAITIADASGLKAGDKIAVRERAKAQTRIQSALNIAGQVGFPDWVVVDDKKMEGMLKTLPERDEILPDINENLVVELYSK